MGEAAAHEEIVDCDLADRAAAIDAVRGCDAILHFAGHPREQSFDEIIADTLPAAYNVYEGARRNGTKRVVYASSIHAVGFHAVEEVPDTRVRHRPDTFYGLTKTFVEDLASLYWDKFGLEFVCLAHLLLLPGAERPAHALVLAQLRRLRAAGGGGAPCPAGRVLGDLRHLRQRRPRRLERSTPATSASARKTAPIASRAPCSPAPSGRTRRASPPGSSAGASRRRRTRTMPTSADVLICGGAVVGSAVAFYLTELGFRGRVVVVEPDPTYARAATALAASGIRRQFSNPLNVRISAFGLEAIRRFGLDFHERGYLTLAAPGPQEAALRADHAVQAAEGAEIELLAPPQLAERFPHLNVGDLALAAIGARGEGWFDNIGLMQAFRSGARARGVEYVRDAVAGIELAGARVAAARLAGGGRIACGAFVDAAGGGGAEVAAMAGIALPVERRKRTVFAFAAADPPRGALPLMVDTSGVWCRPEGDRFIAGATPEPDPAVAADDFEPRHDEWEEVVWPALAARSPAFEALQAHRVLGRPLRHDDARRQRGDRAAPGDRELPLRQRVLGPRAATGARCRARPRRVAELRRVPRHRPRAARLRACAPRRAVSRALGDLKRPQAVRRTASASAFARSPARCPPFSATKRRSRAG